MEILIIEDGMALALGWYGIGVRFRACLRSAPGTEYLAPRGTGGRGGWKRGARQT